MERESELIEIKPARAANLVALTALFFLGVSFVLTILLGAIGSFKQDFLDRFAFDYVEKFLQIAVLWVAVFLATGVYSEIAKKFGGIKIKLRDKEV